MLVLVVVLGSVLVFALFLVLMIPLPAIIINQIAFPLQLIASQFGEAITLAFAMMLLLRRILLQAAAHDSRNASRTSSRHHGRGEVRPLPSAERQLPVGHLPFVCTLACCPTRSRRLLS